MRVPRLSLVAMACVLVLTGCGSSGNTVSARGYATAVCGALRPLITEIANHPKALDPSSSGNAGQIKTAIVAYIDAIEAESGRAMAQLRQSGVPDVKNGKRISQGFLQLFARLHTAFTTAAAQARALPTSDPKQFKTAAAALARQVEQSTSNLGAGAGDLRSVALDRAARQVKACRAVG